MPTTRTADLFALLSQAGGALPAGWTAELAAGQVCVRWAAASATRAGHGDGQQLCCVCRLSVALGRGGAAPVCAARDRRGRAVRTQPAQRKCILGLVTRPEPLQAVRLLRGDPRPSRQHVEPVPAATEPKCPAWLTVPQRRHWRWAESELRGMDVALGRHRADRQLGCCPGDTGKSNATVASEGLFGRSEGATWSGTRQRYSGPNPGAPARACCES